MTRRNDIKLGTITDSKLVQLLYLQKTTDTFGGVTIFDFKTKNGKPISADILLGDCDEDGARILKVLQEA